MNITWKLRCVVCQAEYDGLEARYRCACGETLDVVHSFAAPSDRESLTREFDRRLASRHRADRSGVWRFRELVLPIDRDQAITKPEGDTNLYRSERVAEYAGIDDLALKHEGENPTGSFKDRGMTVGVTVARLLGMTRVACASTGNTSASMASYAAQAGMSAYVFIPEGKIALGKLSQALAYGAKTIQVEGNFDRAMLIAEEACRRAGAYLLNSLNPFRLEGQKAVGFELLQSLGWQPPDWIVLPGGNLGNSSAIYKGLAELGDLGLLRHMPKIAVIQAEGANPLYTALIRGSDLVPVERPDTMASAICIGGPVSWRKSLRAVRESGGTVEQVSDQEIMDAKAVVDAAGIGAEPASCATVAGCRKLVARGVIGRVERVVGILTGHLLKDPDATIGYHTGSLDDIRPTFPNAPVRVSGHIDAVLRAMGA